jgi:hypothetical protein
MNIYDRLRDFIPTEHDVVLDSGTYIGLYTLNNASLRSSHIQSHTRYFIVTLNLVSLKMWKCAPMPHEHFGVSMV